MKKILYIAVTLFSFNAIGQSSILITNNSTSSTLAPNAVINMAVAAGSSPNTTVFDFKNTSGTTKSYNVKRYDVVLNSGASAYFCFAGNCFTPLTTNAGPVTLNGGQSASQTTGSYQMLTADFDEGSTAAYSEIKYTFYDANNTSDSNQVTLKYNGPTGINEVSAHAVSSLEIYPNPVIDNAVIKANASSSSQAKLLVYNSLGALVSERQIFLMEGKNKLDLNTGTLPSGIYFASIKIGNSSETKKFIIK